MNREKQISYLTRNSDQLWDVLVIGGGATGLGIALDAASRGFKTILLEKSDLAQSTSSRSTKLVHGGVRYLAQGDLRLVIEALQERGILLRNAPHLTSNQEFVIPVYSWFEAALYTIGLKFYDVLAGRLSLGKSYFISREKTIERLPNINHDRLRGGVVYHDGQFDDARMAIDLAKAAVKYGAVVLTYFNVTKLLKDQDGRLIGVTATDVITGNHFDISSGFIINATGIFVDEILMMDKPGSKSMVKPSQGVHLVFDKRFLGESSALMIPKTSDGRVLFSIPWYGKAVTGTTDTPLDHISDEPVALEQEIDFILSTCARYMANPPGRKDILSVFAGLRPLAASENNPHSTKEISRRHKIIMSDSGLLTVTGGKWTTYRRMAMEVMDEGIRAGFIEKKRCLTQHLLLDELPSGIRSERLAIYGSGAREIEEMIDRDSGLEMKISPKFPYTMAEIIWICRNEMPVKLEDLMARRLRALFLDAGASMDMGVAASVIMAAETGKDEAWRLKQLESYSNLVRNYTVR